VQALPRSQDQTFIRGPRGQLGHSGAIIANGVPFRQDRSIVALDQHESAEVYVEHVSGRMSTVILQRVLGALKKRDQPGGERHGLRVVRDLGEFAHGFTGVEKNDKQRSHDSAPVLIVLAHQVRESYSHGHDLPP